MGKVWLFGDHINTDQIIPARYYPRENLDELGDFCLCELRPEFSARRKGGDIIVGGENFGCGSSREYAVIAIQKAGIKYIVAPSYARIFFRNCINLGMPAIVCDSFCREVRDNDEAVIHWESWSIENRTTGKSYTIKELPPFFLEILRSGGIINYYGKKRDEQ